MSDERDSGRRQTGESNTFGATRRGVLAAGVAGLGLTGVGTAGAQDGDDDGDPFADEGHDHGGDYLGESAPVSRIDVTDLYTETINSRIEVTTDDDLARKVNQEAEKNDVVVLSAGTHEVDETLRPAEGVSIKGQGYLSTYITATGDFRLTEYLGTKEDRYKQGRLEDLALRNDKQDSLSNLVHAEFADGIRISNIQFGGFGNLGNNLFVKNCFDWKFYATQFARGGDPERGTADIYAQNGGSQSTNNFLFVNCRWEKVVSHALFSDNSGGRTPNGRFLITNGKFHSFSPGSSQPTTPVYHIDGDWNQFLMSNSRFIWADKGFIRNEGNITLLSNCKFSRWALQDADAPAIQANGNSAGITNNQFFFGASDVVEATGTVSVIRGNMVGLGGGITATGGQITVSNNVVNNPGFGPDQLGDGITVGADKAVVTNNSVNAPTKNGIVVTADATVVDGNRIDDAAEDGIHLVDVTGGSVGDNVTVGAGDYGIQSSGSSDGLAVAGNFDQRSTSGGLQLSGENNETAANVSL